MNSLQKCADYCLFAAGVATLAVMATLNSFGLGYNRKAWTVLRKDNGNGISTLVLSKQIGTIIILR